MTPDVVVVGGGIAGSALATVLARAGVSVEVLERQDRHTDRVRGENLHPWGVAEARRLGVEGVLVAAGAHQVGGYVDHGDGGLPVARVSVAGLVDGVDGELNLEHARACRALAEAAATAGARVVHGVRDVEVSPGPRPTVSYRHVGQRRTRRCRLVVGADGRSSRVRHQVGIGLHRVAGAHLVTGMLVDDLDVDASDNVVAIGDDVWMVTFPQGDGRARVYLCRATHDPRRFAGADGPRRFLAAAAIASIPDRRAWWAARPAGPCRTVPGDDTWTDRPFTAGVVLIGDAGGYDDPLIGQGLGLALRDVRALRDLLLGTERWDTAAFATYGTERAERLRRVRAVARLHAAVWTCFGARGRDVRRDLARRKAEDTRLLAASRAVFVGPDRLDPAVCTEEFRRRYLHAEERPPVRAP